jgi:hypothetical protein
MIKDIEIPTIKEVMLAIVPGAFQEEQWEVVLVNKSTFSLKNILVTASGYGLNADGQKTQTSTLRHFFDDLDPTQNLPIEYIDPSVFHLNNEYWVSFWIDEKLYDRRFLFVPESIADHHLVFVEQLAKKAILHA